MADHVRRVLGVLLAAVVLTVAPQVADAAFSGRAAPQMSIGTATMVAPTAVSSTSQCRYFLIFRNGVTVNVSGFTDAGPAGSTYTYRLTRPNGDVLDQETSTGRSATLSTGTALASYRLTIQAGLGGWTSPVHTETVSC